MSEPAHVLHNGIEFVSVHDEQSAAVRRFVNGVFLKRHARIMPVEGGEEFVVIADDVDDFRSLSAFAQKFLNDVVVLLRPVNATAKGPNVDEVADKVEGVKLHILQKIEEDAGFASTRAEMNVRNPTSAIARYHSGFYYPLVERMTKNRELLLFRNTFALVGRKGIKDWSGLAIDSHLKQFSLL